MLVRRCWLGSWDGRQWCCPSHSVSIHSSDVFRDDHVITSRFSPRFTTSFRTSLPGLCCVRNTRSGCVIPWTISLTRFHREIPSLFKSVCMYASTFYAHSRYFERNIVVWAHFPVFLDPNRDERSLHNKII